MRILLVEDDARIALMIQRGFREAFYSVDIAADGAAGLTLSEEGVYGLIILDLMLPKLNGWSLCEELRNRGNKTPILMLTARDSPSERVRGLELGADDYLAKPFDFKELIARVRALIRRAGGQAASVVRCGVVVLDARAARATVNGAPVHLTAHEFRVLSYLMHHRGRVVSQSELLDHIYARDDDRDSNTVEVFIARLRKKLGAATISTVRGLGYRMEEA